MVLSLAKYKWYYMTVLKYLPIIICYTLLSEVLGILIRDFDSFRLIFEDNYSSYNQAIFNIYYLVFFLYFYRVFWKTIKHRKAKEVIKVGVLILVLVSVANLFLQNPIIYPQMFSMAFGSLLLILCIFMYLRESIDTGKMNLLIWISIGLLIFFFFYPVILFIGYFNYEIYQNFKLRWVHRAAIVIMYGCFIMGFIGTKKSVTL